jgi:hypothetical protein
MQNPSARAGSRVRLTKVRYGREADLYRLKDPARAV